MGTSHPATISNVFVYGSLLSDDVVCALLSRVPPSSPATLPDYHRFSIKGRVYPAIIPVENKKVIGKVLIGITPPELYILDTFEDVEYERKTVDVLFNNGSEKLQTNTYVWQNKTDPNLYGEWDFEIRKETFRMMTICSNLNEDESGRHILNNCCDLNSLHRTEWKQLHFEDFLKMTTEFKEELELPNSKTRVATYESFYQGIANNH